MERNRSKTTKREPLLQNTYVRRINKSTCSDVNSTANDLTIQLFNQSQLITDSDSIQKVNIFIIFWFRRLDQLVPIHQLRLLRR